MSIRITGRSPRAKVKHKVVQGHRIAIVSRRIADLTLDPKNPRVHSNTQLKKLARSIKRFGFIVPVLIDTNGRVISGHGRIVSASRLGWEEVPTIRIEHLTPEELKAFQIADNHLTEIAAWDNRLLGATLKELADLDFDIEVIGFETAESDLLIQGLDLAPVGKEDPADQIPADSGPPVTTLGDRWICGRHMVLCADALKDGSYATLLGGKKAAMIFTDPPFGVPVAGHVSGLGRTKHREFVMGSGRSTEAERIDFLTQVLKLLVLHSADGSIHFVAMDFRHMYELLTAGRHAYTEFKNLCVWTKDNAGMGSLYRSQHELFFVFKNGKKPHINQVQLGKFGRWRSNSWRYSGMNSFSRKTEEGNLLSLHPTVKPVALVQDAILDVSLRGQIVLDVFGGSGSTLIACERTGRVAHLMELDPRYCDAIVRRYQAFTGDRARHAVTGQYFGQLEVKAAKKGGRHG